MKVHPTILTASLLWLTLLWGAAAALADDCGESTRVSPPDCVVVDQWTSGNGFRTSWKVTNNCWLPVKMKADVYLSHDASETIPGLHSVMHLGATTSDRTWEGSRAANRPKIRCCGSANGSHCDQSYSSTYTRRCEDGWYYSPANHQCDAAEIEGTSAWNWCRISDITCPITVTLGGEQGTVMALAHDGPLDITLEGLKVIRYCDETLRVNGC